MKELRSLATREGRALVREVFRELRFDKQLSGFTSLSTMWRICSSEREIYRYSNHEVTVLHPLGIWSGTSLWMQEVVNRFYYSTINSFVYFGASILLVMIGIRRFTDQLTDTAVLASIGFEAFLLVMMFVVMFFSPTDESEEEQFQENGNEEKNELLREIGEISRDYAMVAMNMENAIASLRELTRENAELANSVRIAVESAAHAVAPNPELVVTMRAANESMQRFQHTVSELTTAAAALRREEIQASVRSEVERLLHANIKS